MYEPLFKFPFFKTLAKIAELTAGSFQFKNYVQNVSKAPISGPIPFI